MNFLLSVVITSFVHSLRLFCYFYLDFVVVFGMRKKTLFCRRWFCLFALYSAVFKNTIAIKKFTFAMPKWKLWTPYTHILTINTIHLEYMWPLRRCCVYFSWAHLLFYICSSLGHFFFFHTFAYKHTLSLTNTHASCIRQIKIFIKNALQSYTVVVVVFFFCYVHSRWSLGRGPRFVCDSVTLSLHIFLFVCFCSILWVHFGI